VLIAADKRETYQVNGKVVSILSDDVQKLVKWSGGVATGSGYVPLLRDFKIKLSNLHISHTDQIVELARECSQSLPPEQVGWIKSTNWLFTYLANGPEGLVTRVAFIESASPENIGLLKERRSLIWAKMPDYDNQLSRLNSMLKPEHDIKNLRENLNYHLDILASLYAYVATVNPSVSADFECFYHSVKDMEMLPNT